MKTKKFAASSQPEKLVVKSDAAIKAYLKTPAAKALARSLKASGPDPTAEQLRDIPELTDEELAGLPSQ